MAVAAESTNKILWRLCLALICYCILQTAKAADSTASAFTGPSGVTPVTTTIRPYLLDSGYGNMNYYISPNNDNTPTPAGHMRLTGANTCFSGNTSYPSYCTVYSLTNTGALCKANFNAYVAVTPINSGNAATGGTQACVYSQATQDGANSRYRFNAYVSAMATGATTYGPTTSYRWDLYCYPTGTPFPPNDSVCDGPTNIRQSILLWATGVISAPPDTNTMHYSTIGRRCPADHSAYFTIATNKSYGATTSSGSSGYSSTGTANANLMTGFGACIRRISSTNANDYTIEYLTNHRYTRVQWGSSNSYNVNHVYLDVTGYYLWNIDKTWYAWPPNNKVVYSIAPTGNLNNFNVTTTGQENDRDNTGDLTWTQYCYPPGYAPPAYNTTSCSTGVAPYN